MWNSFQGDRESGLFWLLSESIERLKERIFRELFERLDSFLRDYREFLRDYREYFKVCKDYKERVKNQNRRP